MNGVPSGNQSGLATTDTTGTFGTKAADKLRGAASALRDRVDVENGQLTGRLAGRAVSGIESAASYVEGVNLDSIRGSASDVIRRYPLQSLAVGVGLGLFLGKLIRR